MLKNTLVKLLAFILLFNALPLSLQAQEAAVGNINSGGVSENGLYWNSLWVMDVEGTLSQGAIEYRAQLQLISVTGKSPYESYGDFASPHFQGWLYLTARGLVDDDVSSAQLGADSSEMLSIETVARMKLDHLSPVLASAENYPDPENPLVPFDGYAISQPLKLETASVLSDSTDQTAADFSNTDSQPYLFPVGYQSSQESGQLSIYITENNAEAGLHSRYGIRRAYAVIQLGEADDMAQSTIRLNGTLRRMPAKWNEEGRALYEYLIGETPLPLHRQTGALEIDDFLKAVKNGLKPTPILEDGIDTVSLEDETEISRNSLGSMGWLEDDLKQFQEIIAEDYGDVAFRQFFGLGDGSFLDADELTRLQTYLEEHAELRDELDNESYLLIANAPPNLADSYLRDGIDALREPGSEPVEAAPEQEEEPMILPNEVEGFEVERILLAVFAVMLLLLVVFIVSKVWK